MALLSVATNANLPIYGAATGPRAFITFTLTADATEPANSPVTQTSYDTVTYGLDFTSLVSTGDTLSNPVVKLVNLADGSSGPAPVYGPTIQSNVVLLALGNVPNGRYRVLVTVTLNTDKTLTGPFRLTVPF
jgi:hypothetical protein